MKQKTIHISFPQDDIGLYNELMRQCSLSYIPVSALIRNYLKKGIKNQEKSIKSNQYEINQTIGNSIRNAT